MRCERWIYPDKILRFAESPQSLFTGVLGRSGQVVKEVSLSRSRFSIFLWWDLKLGPVSGLPSSRVDELSSADIASECSLRKK